MNSHVKQELDNTARLQQMKINSRLTALQAAQSLMQLQDYDGKRDHITLLAIAGDIEQYILGTLEEETEAALKKAKEQSNVRQIMRP